MRKARMLVKCVFIVAALLISSLPALGQGQMDSEREALFWASHRMAQEKDALPSRQIALFTTTLGSDADRPANFGGRLEAAVWGQIWVSVEAVHLGEDGLDGFASVKLFPFNRRTTPLYLGGGSALGEHFDYQVFVGYEILKNFFVELKYVSVDGSFGDGTPSLTAGYSLPF